MAENNKTTLGNQRVILRVPTMIKFYFRWNFFSRSYVLLCTLRKTFHLLPTWNKTFPLRINHYPSKRDVCINATVLYAFYRQIFGTCSDFLKKSCSHKKNSQKIVLLYVLEKFWNILHIFLVLVVNIFLTFPCIFAEMWNWQVYVKKTRGNWIICLHISNMADKNNKCITNLSSVMSSVDSQKLLWLRSVLIEQSL